MLLEATLNKGETLKCLLEGSGIEKWVKDVNLECNESGIILQGTTNCKIGQIVIKLHAHGFAAYNCNNAFSCRVSLGLLAKVLGLAQDNDRCLLKVTDMLSLKYESYYGDRIEEYKMKLMGVNANLSNLPNTAIACDACVTMSSCQFAYIIHHLASICELESVCIKVSKEGICFSGNKGSTQWQITSKQTDGASQQFKNHVQEKPKKLDKLSSSSKSKKKAEKDDLQKICDDGVHIEMAQELSMSFQVKYLVSISKCATLSDHVQLTLKNDNPLLVSYTFIDSYIQYYVTAEEQRSQ